MTKGNQYAFHIINRYSERMSAIPNTVKMATDVACLLLHEIEVPFEVLMFCFIRKNT